MPIIPTSTPTDPVDDGQTLSAPLSQDDLDAQAESAELEREKREDEILKVARERLKVSEEAYSEIRAKALEDLEFRSGKQWPDSIEQERSRTGRPCLVINRLPQLVQQVTNNQRQNRPSIKVHPVGDGADEDTAKLIQGHIRHIEVHSNADVAYDTATDGQVTSGLGYFRLATGYAAADSFDQEIFIKRIRDPFAVSFDPFSQEPDGSDANWAFFGEYVSKDDYKAQWPNAKAMDDLAWELLGANRPQWMRDGTVRVTEYFYKDLTDVLIHLLSTGETVHDDELQERLQAAAQAGLECHVERSRVAKIPTVRHLKITGVEILEETVFPGQFIPIIPVYGSELLINGKRVLEGIVRHAKDPQRMSNYWKSAETEAIALAPRAPFIVAEGQLEGYEQDWKTANKQNHAYLMFKPTSLNGQPMPPPQRNAVEPAIQAITMAAQGSSDDIKAVTGVYDSAVGAQSNEVSGVAINSRAGQSQSSNFHFYDNLTRSLKHAGRIIVEILPEIYDTARSARIVGEDGTQKTVRFNDPTFKDESGETRLYSLDSGRYGVTVDTGPSYATKRQEAAASMMEFSRAVPQVAQSCADLIVKNMDWPGADALADRLKKMLPPQLQDDGKNKDIPPQAQAFMNALQQQNKMLSDHLNETTKIIETKKLDLEHRERVEVLKLDVDRDRIRADVEIALAKLGSQSSIALLHEEIAALKHQDIQAAQREKLLGINQPIDTDPDFDPTQADGGNYAGFGHVGGSENIGDPEPPKTPTGGPSPGTPMES